MGRSFGDLSAVLREYLLRRAKLEGCILGGNTKVGAKAELSKCVTQAGFEVDSGGGFSAFPMDRLLTTVRPQATIGMQSSRYLIGPLLGRTMMRSLRKMKNPRQNLKTCKLY
jgi:hypothetical protein